MLERLRSINWTSLDDAYGAAESVPDNISLLASSVHNEREYALEQLYSGICHQGCTVYSASPVAVPFLIELIQSDRVLDRGEILRLLGDMVRATGYCLAHQGLESRPRREAGDYQAAMDEERQIVRATRAAVWGGLEIYLTLLAASDGRVGAGAAYVLAFLVTYGLDDSPDPAAATENSQRICSILIAHFRGLTDTRDVAEMSATLANVARTSAQVEQLLNAAEVQESVATTRLAIVEALVDNCGRISASAADFLAALWHNPAPAFGRFQKDDPPDDQGESDSATQPQLPTVRGFWDNYRKTHPAQVDQRATWIRDLVFRLLIKVETVHRTALQPIATERFEQSVRELLQVPAERPLTDADWEAVSAVVLYVFKEGAYQMLRPGTMCASYIPSISKCRNLEWLDLTGDIGRASSWDIDSGLRELRDLPKLKQLNLSNTPVTAAGIRELLRFPSLERLGLYRTELGDEAAEIIGQMHQLRDVWMNHSNVGDQGVAMLARLPNLNRLVLTGTRITDQALVTVGSMTNLETLDLDETAITDAGLAALQNLTNLQYVNLSSVAVEATGLRTLSQMPKLKSLNLTRLDDAAWASDEHLGELGNSRSLEILTLSGRHVSRDVCGRLAGIPTIRELGLYRTGLTDEGLLQFVRTPSLRTINAQQSPVTAAGANEFRSRRPDCKLSVSTE